MQSLFPTQETYIMQEQIKKKQTITLVISVDN